MKHTSNKQEFLVIGRATIESYPKRTPRQRTIENIMKGIIIHFIRHKRNLIHNETYQY